jgi:hypothetical protein
MISNFFPHGNKNNFHSGTSNCYVPVSLIKNVMVFKGQKISITKGPFGRAVVVAETAVTVAAMVK